MSSLPIAIKSVYSTPTINQNIRLYDGGLDIVTDIGAGVGKGLIEQRWLPEPHIFLDCRYEAIQIPENLKAQFGLPGDPKRFNVFVTSMGLGVRGDQTWATLSGHPEEMAWGSAGTLHSLTFHVPNFSWCTGDLVQDIESGEARSARVVNVSVDDWKITIDTVPDYSLIGEVDLEKNSGNAITSVGVIEKKDHSNFSVSSGQNLLDALYLWLSFCRGNWVAPILSVGFDGKNRQVWNDWRQWNFRRSKQVDTWVNRQNSDCLNQTLPGFYARYKNDLWNGPIKYVLGWYVECNRRESGMEASIILCQTALELLGWVSLVEDRKVMSQKGFTDLPASDKVRLLLTLGAIPLAIPSNLVTLGQLAREYNWSDGPECLAGIRNALVHPQLKNRAKIQRASPTVLFEVWSLGLWYLDLLFLKLFEYTGVYRNRLKRECYYDEALEKVPW